jgi:hypothetical protein
MNRKVYFSGNDSSVCLKLWQQYLLEGMDSLLAYVCGSFLYGSTATIEPVVKTIS